MVPPLSGECAPLPPRRPAGKATGTEVRRSAAAQEGGRPRATGLEAVPGEVLGAHIFAYLVDAASYASLITVSKQFYALSQSDVILGALSIEGEREDGANDRGAGSASPPITGSSSHAVAALPSMAISAQSRGTNRRGLIMPEDTAESASARLERFVRAGNPSAMYMLGILRAYCFDDVDAGVTILRRAVSLGHVASAYVLGLILRDCRRAESSRMLLRAARDGYLPALQEVLPQREMKQRHGEPGAAELERYLDPEGLHELLLRHYLRSERLRTVHTSHCWNPKCGRWAYKALPAQPATEEGRDEGPNEGPGGLPSQVIIATGKKKRVSRMKMCSCCRRAKYCSKLCQVFDWRSGRHKMECQYI